MPRSSSVESLLVVSGGHGRRQRLGRQGTGFDPVDGPPQPFLEQALDVVLLDHPGQVRRGIGDVAGQESGVALVCQPVGDPGGDPGVAHAVGDQGRGEQVLLDELAEGPAELVLPLGDDRGVGDRQPQWVAEQGRDREPVGQSADQRGLGRGPHEPEDPTVLTEEDRGQEHPHHDPEQAGGAPLGDHQEAGTGRITRQCGSRRKRHGHVAPDLIGADGPDNLREEGISPGSETWSDQRFCPPLGPTFP